MGRLYRLMVLLLLLSAPLCLEHGHRQDAQLDKEVTSGCIVHSGQTDTLTDATVPLDSGSATLTLTVTPTLRAISAAQ
jgi:hypothetical protein